MDYKGVIFDLDGTLVASTHVWKNIDIKFFAKRGMEVPDDYHEKIDSLSIRDCAEFTKVSYEIEDTVEDIIAEWNGLAYKEYSQNIKLKKGVLEYLNFLKDKGVKIGLATASSKELADAVLKLNNIYIFFDAFVYGSDVDKPKSFPDIYLKCAEKIGVEPNKCLVFEDIEKGIIGAKKAGMIVCGVYDENCHKERNYMKMLCDRYILDFENAHIILS